MAGHGRAAEDGGLGGREARGLGLEAEVWILDGAVHTRPRQEAAGLGDLGVLGTEEEAAVPAVLLCAPLRFSGKMVTSAWDTLSWGVDLLPKWGAVDMWHEGQGISFL